MTIKSCSKKASNQLFHMYWYVSFAHFPPSNCLYSPCLPQKGNLVHTLDHVSGKSCGEGGAGQKAETRRPCVVYSLAYHHKETCLLTAGSYGPVKVWKGQEWSQEDDSIDQWYIGWIITMETEIQTISTKLLWALEDLCAYKTYNIWLCLTQFTSQVLILSSLYKRLLVSCHTHTYIWEEGDSFSLHYYLCGLCVKVGPCIDDLVTLTTQVEQIPLLAIHREVWLKECLVLAS